MQSSVIIRKIKSISLLNIFYSFIKACPTKYIKNMTNDECYKKIIWDEKIIIVNFLRLLLGRTLWWLIIMTRSFKRWWLLFRSFLLRSKLYLCIRIFRTGTWKERKLEDRITIRRLHATKKLWLSSCWGNICLLFSCFSFSFSKGELLEKMWENWNFSCWIFCWIICEVFKDGGEWHLL